MEDNKNLVDNEFLRQFEMSINEELAVIEYALHEKKIFLTKLVIPDHVEGETFKDEFICAVLKNIEERSLAVVPTSPDIAKFIRRNRQFKSMLPVGIRIWEVL